MYFQNPGLLSDITIIQMIDSSEREIILLQRLSSILTTKFHCLDDGYVGKQQVAWKEYCIE